MKHDTCQYDPPHETSSTWNTDLKHEGHLLILNDFGDSGEAIPSLGESGGVVISSRRFRSYDVFMLSSRSLGGINGVMMPKVRKLDPFAQGYGTLEALGKPTG